MRRKSLGDNFQRRENYAIIFKEKNTLCDNFKCIKDSLKEEKRHLGRIITPITGTEMKSRQDILGKLDQINLLK